MNAFEGFYAQALILAVGITRVASAFLLLPLLSPDTVPATVRNSLFISFGLIVIALQPDLQHLQLGPGAWFALFLREAFIGLTIGLFFSSLLWAFEAAGQIIDAKVGASLAQVIDPLSGHQTSLNGAFLGRLANFVFMFSGGLLLMVTVVLESYVLWPITAHPAPLALRGVVAFEREFGRLMGYGVLLAAPALTILFLVEGGLGLLNRYAPQLNVFALSLSIKAWLATAVILASIGVFVQLLVTEIASRPSTILGLLGALSR